MLRFQQSPQDVPFTPFHMSAALLVKSAPRSRFSIIGFGLAQIAIDIKPGIGTSPKWVIEQQLLASQLGTCYGNASAMPDGRSTPVRFALWTQRDKVAQRRLALR